MKEWCRCPKCNHKLFMFVDRNVCDNIYINIKCSSCKKIVDVIVSEGEVQSHESED